jgi:hypothetical protein
MYGLGSLSSVLHPHAHWSCVTSVLLIRLTSSDLSTWEECIEELEYQRWSGKLGNGWNEGLETTQEDIAPTLTSI